MKMQVAIAVTLIALAAWPAGADDPAPTATEMQPAPVGGSSDASSFDALSAPEAVRAGNARLLGDKPTEALVAYDHAHELEPDAREIDFVEGLAYYRLGDYAQAREAFENAATAESDQLVSDAIYSIGTTYHAEALQGSEDPNVTLAQLENAMQRYQTVLADNPDHAAAADANYKAGLTWRAFKQQLEQQQQEQQSSDESCDNPQEQDENDQQEQDQDEKQDQQQNQDQQNEQQQDSSQQPEESEDQQEQQQPSASEDQQEQEPQEAQASQEEQVSREQAERKLREMMQALRDRKKERPEQTQRVRPVHVEKDW